MKYLDKKKIRVDHSQNGQPIAKRGDEIEFQDNVRHITNGIMYQFQTMNGDEIWLKENQFRK